MYLTPRRLLPDSKMMIFSPHSVPAHHQITSNFISPGMAASSATMSVPWPVLAKAAAEMIDSVLPFSSSESTGWVPTREARHGISTR